jgi:hypothetical protein
LRKDVIEQLSALGYELQEHDPEKISLPYKIEAGEHAGKEIRIGFIINDQMPFEPPSGPHITPHLYPIHPQNDVPHPRGAVHSSPFGEHWQYWSRPCGDWRQTDGTMRAYMKFIRGLFAKNA